MAKEIIFQDSFLVSGIMCHQGCGGTIQSILSDLNDFKKQGNLPADARLIIDAEPQALGIHRLVITVESDEEYSVKNNALHKEFKNQIENSGYAVIDESTDLEENKNNWVNWFNILSNTVSMSAIILLSIVFPPSILLTVGLSTLSFITTAFTSRSYLFSFINNLRNNDWANMTSAVALGWFLALAHTLYHSISMPLTSSFSMMFMSFVMPIILITIINGMDEIKRLVMNKSKKIHLQGINTLFPEMSKEYLTHQLSVKEQDELSQIINAMQNPDSEKHPKSPRLLQQLVSNSPLHMKKKNSIMKEELIRIHHGECFPVDCVLTHGTTLVDASLLTGEPQQEKHLMDFIPAGAINLGGAVTVYAMENSYNSTINKLLFRSNRANESHASETNLYFTYLYSALIIVGIAASVLIPLAFGSFTVSLLLQNLTGILFAVCPCTIGIAHQLPDLLSNYYRSRQGIKLANEHLITKTDKIHTVVFDKTGTLTTGQSQVDSFKGISSALWQRIYLLEKKHGAEHPLAKALYQYYEKNGEPVPLINDIRKVKRDAKNRGLSAVVQGKKIHLGNAAFLRDNGIKFSLESLLPVIKRKITQGYSAVYVAEDSVYSGVILIKHEIRPNILTELTLLKKEGIKLIMLTGDNALSAEGFNQQNGCIFAPNDIHADQTPENKEQFLKELMSQPNVDPKGIWFVGDGLNDAPCARIVSEQGGVSCAMTANDKSAFFTDLSFNGSLDYLFQHEQLNHFAQKNVLQNQWLLGYGAATFLAFIITFSVMGIAISPLIPMVIMVSTTLLSLFNSYRVKYSVANALDKKESWFNQFLTSDISLGLLVSSNALFLAGSFISSIAAASLTVPALVFSTGVAALASACLIAAGTALGLFILVSAVSLVRDHYAEPYEICNESDIKPYVYKPSALPIHEENPNEYCFGFGRELEQRASSAVCTLQSGYARSPT